MKKIIVLSIAAICLAVLSLPSYAAITGSKHDFRLTTPTDYTAWSNGDLCTVCHTPHNSEPTADWPLWSRSLTSSTFTTYSSNTLDASTGALNQPSGVSKLCLGCHDGTISLNAYKGSEGGAQMITGIYNLGTDITGTHPVGFTYDSALSTADGELHDPEYDSRSALGGSTIQAAWMSNSTAFECSSCHDVHNGPNVETLLYMSKDGGALCLVCHDK